MQCRIIHLRHSLHDRGYLVQSRLQGLRLHVELRIGCRELLVLGRLGSQVRGALLLGVVEVGHIMLCGLLLDTEAGLGLELLEPWHLAGGREAGGKRHGLWLGEVAELCTACSSAVMQALRVGLQVTGARRVPVTALLDAERISSMRTPLGRLGIRHLRSCQHRLLSGACNQRNRPLIAISGLEVVEAVLRLAIWSRLQ